ncbi:MAG: peptide MFS transporter [Opitutia bacterium]
MPDPAPHVPESLPDGGIGGHPRGLSNLFYAEMWERFSFYGMRALLLLFMLESAEKGGMGWDQAHATTVYGNYTMLTYMVCILGGFIADNFLGARRAVLIGGSIITAGHFTLAVPGVTTFYAGLALVAAGTGLLKPSISTLVGGLYAPGDHRRDAGFSIFYMGINLGAFAAPLVTGWLAQGATFRAWLSSAGLDPASAWHWGFAAAGVGMTFGLTIYVRRIGWLGRTGDAPPPGPRPWGRLAAVAAGTAALGLALSLAGDVRWTVPALCGLTVAGAAWLGLARKDGESRRMAAVLIFFLAATLFWAIFEQAGSTLTLFADELTRNEAFGEAFPSSWWQSVNALMVMALAPAFAWAWTRLGDRQPSVPVKFGLGLVFLGLSFALMVPAAALTAAGKVGPEWLLSVYLLQTVAEMFLSPVGLSTMTKLAPARLTSMVMGVWFLATAIGSKLAGSLAGEFTAKDPAAMGSFFLGQTWTVAAVAVMIFLLTPWIRRLMEGR